MLVSAPTLPPGDRIEDTLRDGSFRAVINVVRNGENRLISFIVPAYDEEILLAATLDALHAAGKALNEPYELVVADDASTDRTASIAERHGARVVRVAHRQIAATRNSGARAAMGELFIFVDADTIVSEAVVRAAVDAMRGGAVGGGACVEFERGVPWYAKLLMPVLAWFYRAAGLAAGCFVFCSRDAFVRVGGFDEAFFGAEEVVLSRALRDCGRFVVLKEAVTTSGRKLRTHSGVEVFKILARLALRGSQAVKQREGMELWYAERRHDPKKNI
jgi:glycosyltransferase involved in cell wall biosynthesis